MFLMNMKSVTRWLVMTEFEMLLNIVGLFATTILVCLKLDYAYAVSWKLVIMPMFVGDALQAYFCIIVFIRQFFQYQAKPAVLRLIISSLFVAIRFSFKIYVYLILNVDSESSDNEGLKRFDYGSFPLFLHLTMLIFRSCQLKKDKILD